MKVIWLNGLTIRPQNDDEKRALAAIFECIKTELDPPFDASPGAEAGVVCEATYKPSAMG